MVGIVFGLYLWVWVCFCFESNESCWFCCVYLGLVGDEGDDVGVWYLCFSRLFCILDIFVGLDWGFYLFCCGFNCF